MTRLDRHPTRRGVMGAGLSLAAAGSWLPNSVAPAFAQTGGGARLKAYLANAGSVSKLTDPDYQRVFKNIFSGQDVTLELEPVKYRMIRMMLVSDIVYLSVHSNHDVLVAADGGKITPEELTEYRGKVKHSPGLVVVAGCLTLNNDSSIPNSLGIDGAASGVAYVGFSKKVIGFVVDQYFRVFFSMWLRPKPDGTYRTLAEARADADDFIEKHLDSGVQDHSAAGKMMKFEPATRYVGANVEIVGDGGLTLPALERAVAAAGANTPSSGGGTSQPPKTNGSGSSSPSTGGSSSGGSSSGGGSAPPSSGGGWSSGGTSGGTSGGGSGSSGGTSGGGSSGGGSSGGGFWSPGGGGGSGGTSPTQPSGGTSADDINKFLKR